MAEILLDLGRRRYSIEIRGGGLLDELDSRLRNLNLGEQVALITSPTVRQLYGEIVEKSLGRCGFGYLVIEIPDGEENKSLARYEEALDQLVPFNNERRTFIVNLGGGVVGDLGGFVAATFRRGVPYVQIPTTLLAQVDCAIGGKVGVNHPLGKNYIGSFYQPSAVFIDLSVLKTLPKREKLSGLAEIVKYGVACDLDLYEYVESHLEAILALDAEAMQHVVERSCAIKARIVEKDERDTQGLRARLNLGHTIGHALEASSDYSLYKHGEAISVGMVCACEIAVMLNIFDKTSAARIESLLINAGLPVRTLNGSIADIMKAIRRDKKAEGGRNKFVLPTRIGETRIETGVSESLIEQVLERRTRSLASV